MKVNRTCDYSPYRMQLLQSSSFEGVPYKSLKEMNEFTAFKMYIDLSN